MTLVRRSKSMKKNQTKLLKLYVEESIQQFSQLREKSILSVVDLMADLANKNTKVTLTCIKRANQRVWTHSKDRTWWTSTVVTIT